MPAYPALLTIAVLAASAGAVAAESASWVFLPSTYTHDRMTGARVAQYAPIAAVEGLPDPRLVTSGYRRTRTTLPGPNGSVDISYQVQSFANGRGGIDAEWERVADEWRASILSGGSFIQAPGFGFPGVGVPGVGVPGFAGQGFAGPGFIGPGFGAPGFVGPGFGNPAFGNPGFGQPGFFAPGAAPQGSFFPPGFGFGPGFGPSRDRPVFVPFPVVPQPDGGTGAGGAATTP
ncbi:MAG: hypothetical protein AAF596_04150 [Planctomycetota bacterium]